MIQESIYGVSPILPLTEINRPGAPMEHHANLREDVMKSVNPYIAPRERMIVEQLAAKGVRDERVLDAMRQVAREAFVPAELREAAYDDRPLPLGEGQTISQPYIVGAMTEALGLEGGENVLEIGTGSGYAAAVLSHIARVVHSIERIPALARRARETLRRLGYDRVAVIEGDGTLGWLPAAPYDAIVATAEGPGIPPSLRAQLKPGGRLVMPVEDAACGQALVRLVRGDDGKDRVDSILPVRFVPLIGAEGWPDEDAWLARMRVGARERLDRESLR
jgi:protein-L-isoaspartate(D-aspartate) O-methyltransferase